MSPYQGGFFEQKKPDLTAVIARTTKKELPHNLKDQKIEAIKQYIEPFLTTEPYKTLMQQAKSDLDLHSFALLVNQAIKENLVYESSLKRQLQTYNAAGADSQDLIAAEKQIKPTQEESSWWGLGSWLVTQAQPKLPVSIPDEFIRKKGVYIRDYLITQGFRNYQNNPTAFIENLNKTFKGKHPLFFHFLEIYHQVPLQQDIQRILNAITQELPHKKQEFLKQVISPQRLANIQQELPKLTQELYAFYPNAKIFGETIQQEDLSEFLKIKTVDEQFPGLRTERMKKIQEYIQHHEDNSQHIQKLLTWLATTEEPTAFLLKQGYKANKENAEIQIDAFKKAILNHIQTSNPELYSKMQTAQLNTITNQELEHFIRTAQPLTAAERAAQLLQHIKQQATPALAQSYEYVRGVGQELVQQAAPTVEQAYKYTQEATKQAAAYTTKALQTGWSWLKGLVEESPIQQKPETPQETPASLIAKKIEEPKVQGQEQQAPEQLSLASEEKKMMQSQEKPVINSLAEYLTQTKKSLMLKNIFKNFITKFLESTIIPENLDAATFKILMELDTIRFNVDQKLMLASSILTQLTQEFSLPEYLQQSTLQQIEQARSLIRGSLIPRKKQFLQRSQNTQEFDQLAQQALTRLKPAHALYQEIMPKIKRFAQGE
jgi:hypothetical protein